jgi:hypothetical protein
VDLHQVEALDAELANRVAHLADAGRAAAGPDLGRDEQALAHAELRGQLPGHRLG